jgi:hypothetical protein
MQVVILTERSQFIFGQLAQHLRIRPRLATFDRTKPISDALEHIDGTMHWQGMAYWISVNLIH